MFDKKKYRFLEEEAEFIPILPDTDGQDVQVFEDDDVKEELGILPIRNTVLFPGVVLPIAMNREMSMRLVTKAYQEDKYVGVVAQKDNQAEEIQPEDLLRKGTIAKILKLIKLPDGTNTVIIQGRSRFQIEEFTQEQPFFQARISLLKDIGDVNAKTFVAQIASLKDLALKIIELSSSIPSEAALFLKNISNPLFLAHFIAGNIAQPLEEKQKMIEADNISERVGILLKILQKELQFLELKNKVANKTKTELDKQQKEYFLQQQLKSIREELGDSDNSNDELQELCQLAKQKKWPVSVQELFEKRIKKLEQMPASRPDYSVELTHLETLLELPWQAYSSDVYDIKKAERILNKDHFGMKKVKERILEYIAVLSLKKDLKGAILCFSGPPGIGKTSLARSVANALGRSFVKISLGGVHDESEIRGHRKTYIGAMPGRIIQSINKAKVSNPVLLLDEIDKVGKDYRGDVAGALLEVLDPEQNAFFYDNYLEVEYDLSKVLFITTANNIGAIPAPLRDRLEIIELSGYVLEEKIQIARRYLLSRQMKEHGLDKTKAQVKVRDKVLRTLISAYTHESGVRGLERCLAQLMRYAVKEVVASGTERVFDFDEVLLEEVLGKPHYSREAYKENLGPGVAVGLAWTPVGGEILFIESALSEAKKGGGVRLTGNLGNVMKESAALALTFLKSKAAVLGIAAEQFEQFNIHIHVPEGAVPKDGPSAGIAILSALYSVLKRKKVKKYVAMTGEITLRGAVLPVGGIKEKILAAKRAGIKQIIMSAQNEKDIREIETEYIKGLQFHFVQTMDEVLGIAFNRQINQA